MLMVLLTIVISVSGVFAQDAPTKPFKLTVIHISDTHAHMMNFDNKNGSGPLVPMYNVVKNIREQVKKEGGYVLFLHSGDINDGMPESDMLDAKPDIDVLNIMKLDAMAVGNHEFYKPLNVLEKQIKESNFNFLMANVKYKNGEYIANPYVIKEIDGHKFCIFGLLTTYTALKISKDMQDQLSFEEPNAVAKNITASFPKGCFIIALSHLGLNKDLENYGDLELAKKNPNIDLILGGHTHLTLDPPLKRGNALIVHSGFEAKGVGRLDLELNGNKITNYKYEYIPIDEEAKNGAEDPRFKALLKQYMAKVSPYLDKKIASSRIALSKSKVREKETAIGDLIADSMLEKGKCDIAIMNAGNIRSELPEGILRVRDAYKVYPATKTIVVSQVKLGELMEILKQGYFNQIRKDKPRFLQIAGIRIKIKNKKIDIKQIQGKDPDPNKKYSLCTDDLVASGGNGVTFMEKISDKTDTGYNIRDAVVDKIKKEADLNYKTDGRIQLLL
jgi:5'-nucleotidase/UDP-sugar diphosphatase